MIRLQIITLNTRIREINMWTQNEGWLTHEPENKVSTQETKEDLQIRVHVGPSGSTVISSSRLRCGWRWRAAQGLTLSGECAWGGRCPFLDSGLKSTTKWNKLKNTAFKGLTDSLSVCSSDLINFGTSLQENEGRPVRQFLVRKKSQSHSPSTHIAEIL